MILRNLFLLMTISVAICSCNRTTSISDKPNVVVIVADDFGWMDTGFQGSDFYETPNLDRLASEGMVFTDGYASCGVCSPSRASLLTGRYTPRSGITDWIKGYQADKTPEELSEYAMVGPQNVYNLPLEETTLAEAVKTANYKTCFVGKWHLGEDSLYYPQYHGFDKNVAGWLRGGPSGDRKDQRSYYTPYNNPYLTDGPEGEFLTDRLVKESISWMDENKKDPFLMYLSFYTVHTPIHPKPEKVPYYKEKAIKLGLDTVPHFYDKVPWMENWPKNKWHWKERMVQSNAEYAALIESMDENIGKVLDYLKASGIDDNTIVVFTSDNGGLSTAEGSPTCNAPLRGGKGWLYEGGIREPFLVKIPGKTKPGTVCSTPVHSVDVYPTILSACGIDVPNKNAVDGVNLLPLIEGSGLKRDALYWHYPHYGGKGDQPAGAIRKGDYKLLELFETGEVQLFNLKKDIGETKDLSKELPEIAEELLNELRIWRTEVGAKMPTENPYYKFK
ncbi:sulfatase [Carboxylicivirga sp. M1479]|uniref:sulfatase n=1 Tax=Carboxylicivirga sp. M1479 TaxID=2594476 RepID=UPI001C8F8FBE|nr:sulfatase [Carboxylicivirga sp. M1479]